MCHSRAWHNNPILRQFAPARRSRSSCVLHPIRRDMTTGKQISTTVHTSGVAGTLLNQCHQATIPHRVTPCIGTCRDNLNHPSGNAERQSARLRKFDHVLLRLECLSSSFRRRPEFRSSLFPGPGFHRGHGQRYVTVLLKRCTEYSRCLVHPPQDDHTDKGFSRSTFSLDAV